MGMLDTALALLPDSEEPNPLPTDNTFDGYCTIMGMLVGYANTKAMDFGTTLFANGMSNGDNIMAYCNMMMDISRSANRCVTDTATDCLTKWNEVVAETEDTVDWVLNPTLGIKIPVAPMLPEAIALLAPTGALDGMVNPEMQHNDAYCDVYFALVEKHNAFANHLFSTLGTYGFATGAGDEISQHCFDRMMDEIEATVGGLIIKIALGVAGGSILLTVIGACAYCKFCQRKETAV